ncbi:glycosyl hydrolase family 28-related protein [Baaleninema simplex]|uniref:glycosyl hydrolase family 28-related protein n=1 Tax=Baaleninema simplex TaxID=2862350 RepID=UPI0003619C0B|nr:glycosyl hydrolase family 28-related protein [Baaleninema simplex]
MNFPRKWKYVAIALLSLAFVLGIYLLYRTYPGSEAVSMRSPNTEASTPVSLPRFVNNCGTSTPGETENPIAAAYGNSAYPWTNEIRWQCVYNIEDFPGNSLDERFRVARDTASNNGGGVVYFPAGTYRFSENLELADGVVLRGATPAVTDAKSSEFRPPTRLEFPKYEPRFSGNGTPNETAFKQILTKDANRDSKIGLVDLDIDRAGIKFSGNPKITESRNIVVFGIRSNNVAEPDPNVPDRSFQKPWFRYSYRFAANIDIDARENVLVANNRVNDSITDNFDQPGYTVKSLDRTEVITYNDGSKVPFHYGNHYGIIVNRSGRFEPSETPETAPELFRKGVTIRDNWVYHTMRVAIHAAGDGLIVRDNVIRDDRNKQWWTDATGLREPRGANTLENRGIDWSGWNVEVIGNDFEVYRHRLGSTNYLSVDGEGILIQACCGGTTVNGATIRANRGNAYIGLYKVGDIRNVAIADNDIEPPAYADTSAVYVVADTNDRPHSMENVRVENNRVGGSITVSAKAGGRNNLVVNNRGDGSGAILRSCHVQLRDNRGFEEKPCSD